MMYNSLHVKNNKDYQLYIYHMGNFESLHQSNSDPDELQMKESFVNNNENSSLSFPLQNVNNNCYRRWKIDGINTDALIDIINNEPFTNGTYLLMKKPIEEYDLLEKFVYDTAQFHFNQLGINYDKNLHNIEFWYKKKANFNLHIDCDEIKKKTKCEYIHPLLSCVTYLNDNNFPLLLTNITYEKYKYKEFDHESTISLVFPKKNTQVTFKENTYHGTVCLENIINSYNRDNSDNILDRYIIAINIWDNKILNSEYYSSTRYILDNKIEPGFIEIVESHESQEIFVENKLTYSFFKKLLYDDIFTINDFENITGIYSYYKIIDIQNNIKIKNMKKIEVFKKDLENIIESIDCPRKLNPFNRFIQRYTYPSIYSKDVCQWFIHESEAYASKNGGWCEYRHKSYPTVDLPIKDISTIFHYFVFSLQSILSTVKKAYDIPDGYYMNIIDAFIIKYKSNQQNELEFHTDGSIVSFNILLNNENDFEGGGTYFSDNLQVASHQGDLMIHCGKIKHAGGKITKGTRYLLVCFVDIIFLS